VESSAIRARSVTRHGLQVTNDRSRELTLAIGLFTHEEIRVKC
jgi:hypothetical protein